MAESEQSPFDSQNANNQQDAAQTANKAEQFSQTARDEALSAAEKGLEAARAALEAAERKLAEAQREAAVSRATESGVGEAIPVEPVEATSARADAAQQTGFVADVQGTAQQPNVDAAAQSATQQGFANAGANNANAQSAAQQTYQQAAYQQPGAQQAGYQQQAGAYQVPPQPNYAVTSRTKDHVAAGLLAIFFGALGIHKFYLGYNTQGFIMLALSVFGILTFGIVSTIVWLIAIIEGIIYLVKSQSEFEQIYVYQKREWF